MALPLMPKATAVWLVESTTLTFDQIAAFCGLHPLEVAGIADDEVAIGIQGLDPIARGQLTREEIEASEADAERALQLAAPRVVLPPRRASGPRYTPVSKRQDRPNAIAWLLRFHPELSDAQISRLVGTTKPTIGAIRDRTHWNITNIRHQDPVSLGLCSQTALDEAVTKGRARERAKEAREAKAAAKARRDKQAAAESAAASEGAAEPAQVPQADAEPSPDPSDQPSPGETDQAAPLEASVPALAEVRPAPAVVPPAGATPPALAEPTTTDLATDTVPPAEPPTDLARAEQSPPEPTADSASTEEAPPPIPEDRETP